MVHPNICSTCTIGRFVFFLSLASLASQSLTAYLMTQITALERQFGFSSSQMGLVITCNDFGFIAFSLLTGYLAPKVRIPRFMSLNVGIVGIAALACTVPYFVSKHELHGDSYSSLSSLHRLPTTDTHIGNSSQRENITLDSPGDGEDLYSPTSEINDAINATRLKEQPLLTKGMDSEIGELNSFQLMTILASRCTGVPKLPRNCSMEAKILNKGYTNKYTNMAFAVLIVSLVVQGAARSHRMPMTLLYLEENGSKTKTPIYLSVVLISLGLGVVLAYGLGVLASRLYVTMEAVPIHPLNPHWIGAWWLGCLVIALLCFLTALPLLFFPRRLRKRPNDAEAPASASANKKAGKEIANGLEVAGHYKLLSTLKRCFTNPVLMGISFCGTVAFFLLAGPMPFSAKYFETQFRLPAWKANVIVGTTKIIPALLGFGLSGAFISRRNLSPMAMCRLGLVSCAGIVAWSVLGFLFGCDTVEIVGFNAPERLQETVMKQNATECASMCHCNEVDYFPVCGSNGRNYFSACHAGCLDRRDAMFTACSCIGGNGTGSPGLCQENTCRMLGPYVVVSCVGIFLGACIGVVLPILGLRCVEPRDKSLAVAVFMFLSNLLGWLPAPVVFGKLVDSACVIWNTGCADMNPVGACALYDARRFRTVHHSYLLVSALILACGVCFVMFKGRKKTDWQTNASFLRNVTESQKATDQTEMGLMADEIS